MAALPTALATMRGCHVLGACFALDDFGSGYSSLADLKTMPVAAVKIDRSFIACLDTGRELREGRERLERREGDRRIAQDIVELIAGYGLQSLGEGVETEAQPSELLAAGCGLGQGYGILRPVEQTELMRWLQQLPKRRRPAGVSDVSGSAA